MGAQILPSRSVLGPYGEQTPFFLIRGIPPISRLLGSRVIIIFRKCSSTKVCPPSIPPFLSTQPGLSQSLNILPFTNLSIWAIRVKISVFLLIDVYLKIQSEFLESRDHVPIIKLGTPSIYPNAGHIADDQLIWKSINIQMDGSTSETLLSDDITV